MVITAPYQSEKADPERHAPISGDRNVEETPEHVVDPAEADAEIHRIASQVTAQDQPTMALFPIQADSKLDPNSPNFNPRSWAKAYYDARNDALDGASPRKSGFAFKNMNVFGFGSSIDFQKDVTHLLHGAYDLARRALGQSKNQRIDILRDCEGKTQ